MYINTHVINGNLGRDPELRETKSGKVLSFSVASTSPYGAKKTTWYDVSVWGKRAEQLAPLLTKGSAVVLVGESGPETFTDKNGAERFKMVFRAENVQLAGKSAAASSAEDSDDDEDEDTTDIPF